MTLVFASLSGIYIGLVFVLATIACGFLGREDQLILARRGFPNRVSWWFAAALPVVYLHLRARRTIGDDWEWHRPVLVWLTSLAGGAVFFIITLVLAASRAGWDF